MHGVSEARGCRAWRLQVIAYIASHFRKDKIWMRRTRPDKRRYQVVVAIDDSRSMAETGCGTAALEALTLICKAMARLEVRERGRGQVAVICWIEWQSGQNWQQHSS